MKRLVFVAGLLAAMVCPALAQYSFDPNNADEKGPGIKYFGSAKDDQGALLPGVTIMIAHYFTMVTDEQGRYRGNVDASYTATNTPVGCSKPGYSFVRTTKRAGPPGGVKQTVEADCVLHKDK